MMQLTFDVMLRLSMYAAMIGLGVHLIVTQMRHAKLIVRRDELATRLQEATLRTREATERLRALELQEESEEITRNAIEQLLRTLAELEIAPLEPVNMRLRPEEYRRAVTSIMGSTQHRKNPGSTESCAICLDAMEDGATWHKIECGHQFHPGCLTDWLQKQCRLPRCPLCRFDVRDTKCALI
tara:strand:+ start:519 stop:1067 length:549 start_codon:yes stop_codon:yes gene_type:complete